MARILTFLPFPNPPEQYSQEYMAQLVRTFSVFQEQINTPGESRATGLTLTNLQSDDSGLEAGAVFQHGGILRIPVTNSPFVRGSVGTSAVGSVTVTTS
jgi:hypothetical protein|tara:strand:- start:389 stop:685 length:297 start_codon:yes stop_codon:yes gene_type:complete